MAIGCCGNGNVWCLSEAKINMVVPSGNHALNMRKNDVDKQKCPVCGYLIGVIAGSKEAICSNCGFKDPCCE